MTGKIGDMVTHTATQNELSTTERWPKRHATEKGGIVLAAANAVRMNGRKQTAEMIIGTFRQDYITAYAFITAARLPSGRPKRRTHAKRARQPLPFTFTLFATADFTLPFERRKQKTALDPVGRAGFYTRAMGQVATKTEETSIRSAPRWTRRTGQRVIKKKQKTTPISYHTDFTAIRYSATKPDRYRPAPIPYLAATTRIARPNIEANAQYQRSFGPLPFSGHFASQGEIGEDGSGQTRKRQERPDGGKRRRIRLYLLWATMGRDGHLTAYSAHRSVRTSTKFSLRTSREYGLSRSQMLRKGHFAGPSHLLKRTSSPLLGRTGPFTMES
ncbi:hypothetical protein HD553DRAFT_325487 [Filobasidium floriforme]|uniref:uncharacterized protein n=1 Tax=Filobasidium floriforme TaxID=5210 RepID=UPI001E8CAE40|nr:uncharacterized protein HD553DRAFT_325487 [Filobasidium floriforme]KAH8081468.1 hypothetical protein HD553DRAFT_325487 [Filobasidium floriforme]